MIVRNEEKSLARCLDSVKELADEIVIVDTGSTDRTKDIAAQYTTKVYSFDWIDDFSAARNESFSYAAGDYILWLDADDWLRQEDADKLKTLKNDLNPNTDVVCMDYYVAFDPLGEPTAVVKRDRLVKRSRHFQWCDPVHEYLAVKGRRLMSDIAICHGREERSTDRNLLIYEAVIARGDTLSLRQRQHYAMELAANERYEQAIGIYEQIAAHPLVTNEAKLECCDRMAHCYHELGNREEELQALLRLFRYDVPRADYVCRIAYYFQENREWAKAVSWYRRALELDKPEGRITTVNPAAWTWFPHLQLAACYGKLGKLRQAYKHNEIALSYSPNDRNLLTNKELLERHMEKRSGGAKRVT